ncbi:aminoacyl-tRNA hydrolase, partial [Arthrobacter deserti]|nr:aminoacyl-tRNA hydrolase [Arthrobacter deserti]
MGSETWLVVGLGNPGPYYSHNRHNVGQMVLDELAGRIGGSSKSHKARAQVLEGRLGIGGPRVVLAKPLTFMNVSGG